MFKRRIAALVAVGAVVLAGGLAGSANASSGEPPAKGGTCVTSDGKTFEFSEAVPALKLEPGKKGAAVLSDDESVPGSASVAAVRVEKAVPTTEAQAAPEGAVRVERWSKVVEATETTEAVPAKPAPGVEAGEAKVDVEAVEVGEGDVKIATPDGENAHAVTITCTAK
ncbi:hypothetical protein ACFXJ8_38995 [Nonomuraea sp. NPDC059194]|uniref:hypothetical protein n=1 Tax=Nonomuraea sp. NPDC059194 TaxID=3346764 RepID=UPI0036C8340F